MFIPSASETVWYDTNYTPLHSITGAFVLCIKVGVLWGAIKIPIRSLFVWKIFSYQND